MYQFLENNRQEVIARCKQKVAERPFRVASEKQLSNGIPMFLDQLCRTLRADEYGKSAAGLTISGKAGGDAAALSEIGLSAAAHGKMLLDLGYTVDQVVHDYGDICQSITDLAVERDAPFQVEEFRTFNRCLDNAIADAVSSFSSSKAAFAAHQAATDAEERIRQVVDEARGYLQTALNAFVALETGRLSFAGSTGNLLKRSLLSIDRSLNAALVGRQGAPEAVTGSKSFSLSEFIEEAAEVASFVAMASGCTFTFGRTSLGIAIVGNRELLLAALQNVLQNAFQFTRPHSEVSMDVDIVGPLAHINVSDHCGGLDDAVTQQFLSESIAQAGAQGKLRLGLTIAKRSVEANGGTLTVLNMPGLGCTFTMSLPYSLGG